jgi:WD40 repeat protein
MASVLTVAFSPDGSYLAASDMKGEIYLYQVADELLWFTFKGHADWVEAIAFSPDGSTLASSSHDRTIRLWDVHTGCCRQTLLGHAPLTQREFDGYPLARN